MSEDNVTNLSQNKNLNHIDIITIDDEDDVLDNDEIQIIEVKCTNSSVDCPSIDKKPKIAPESPKPETLADNCSTYSSVNNLSDKIRKSPKRIIPVKVESIPSTSQSNNSERNDLINGSIADQIKYNGSETNGATPNKVQRTISPKTKESNDATEVDINQLYENYLKVCRDRMNAVKSSEHNETKTDELINRLNEIVMQLKSESSVYVTSKKQFKKLLKVFAKEIADEKDDNRVFTRHNDLMIELKRLAKKPKTNANRTKMSKETKQKRIDKLTAIMKEIQQQIFKAENEVLDYKAMENETSFTDLPKLYKKLNQVWTKREELLKRSVNTGRIVYKKFEYNSTPYSEINTSVENMFNNFIKKLKNWNNRGFRDETFTFIDVHKTITEVIKDKKLEVRNPNQLIEEIYRDLSTEMRKRRILDTEDVFETLETLEDLRPETFVDNDPAIDIEISKNKSFYERKLQELLQTYTNRDKEKNGETLIDEGVNEWDQTLEDNEEFESIDVKDGDLDNEEDSDDEEINDVT